MPQSTRKDIAFPSDLPPLVLGPPSAFVAWRQRPVSRLRRRRAVARPSLHLDLTRSRGHLIVTRIPIHREPPPCHVPLPFVVAHDGTGPNRLFGRLRRWSQSRKSTGPHQRKSRICFANGSNPRCPRVLTLPSGHRHERPLAPAFVSVAVYG